MLSALEFLVVLLLVVALLEAKINGSKVLNFSLACLGDWAWWLLSAKVSSTLSLEDIKLDWVYRGGVGYFKKLIFSAGWLTNSE